MKTVGELKAFLSKWHDSCQINVNMGANGVKGMELSYDITTDSMSITPVYAKNSFIIEAKA